MKYLAAAFVVLLFNFRSASALSDPIGAPTPVSAENSKTSETAVQNSTTPLGSPYYRHLAFDFDIPIKELVKFERKGFGRTEVVEIILIANGLDKPIKEIGNRRIKDHVPMETLAKEAGLNYLEMAKVAREIKLDIESRGDKDLPPAVFDTGVSTAAASPTSKPPKKKKK